MARRPLPVLLVAAGFAIGATFHAADFMRYGWWPYRFGGVVLDTFWNALLPLDLLVVVALLLRGQRALWMAAVLIALDVAANSWAWQVLGIRGFANAVPVQAAFGAFVWCVAMRNRARIATGPGRGAPVVIM